MATSANEMKSNEVLFEVSDHVATITFNRPERRRTLQSPRATWGWKSQVMHHSPSRHPNA